MEYYRPAPLANELPICVPRPTWGRPARPTRRKSCSSGPAERPSTSLALAIRTSAVFASVWLSPFSVLGPSGVAAKRGPATEGLCRASWRCRRRAQRKPWPQPGGRGCGRRPGGPGSRLAARLELTSSTSSSGSRQRSRHRAGCLQLHRELTSRNGSPRSRRPVRHARGGRHLPRW